MFILQLTSTDIMKLVNSGDAPQQGKNPGGRPENGGHTKRYKKSDQDTYKDFTNRNSIGNSIVQGSSVLAGYTQTSANIAANSDKFATLLESNGIRGSILRHTNRVGTSINNYLSFAPSSTSTVAPAVAEGATVVSETTTATSAVTEGAVAVNNASKTGNLFSRFGRFITTGPLGRILPWVGALLALRDLSKDANEIKEMEKKAPKIKLEGESQDAYEERVEAYNENLKTMKSDANINKALTIGLAVAGAVLLPGVGFFVGAAIGAGIGNMLGNTFKSNGIGRGIFNALFG